MKKEIKKYLKCELCGNPAIPNEDCPYFQDEDNPIQPHISKKCVYCKNLDEMEKECPDSPHHGYSLYCDECGADYYEEYMGKIWATNEIAKINHPELQKL